MSKRTACRYYLPIATSAALFVVFIVLEMNMVTPNYSVPLKGKLGAVAETRIDVFLDLTKLFISLSIAVLGVVGFLLKTSVERSSPLPRDTAVIGVLTIGFSVVSIFFGHMSFNVVLFMLSKDAYPEQMEIYGLWQYVFFGASLISLAACVTSLLVKQGWTAE